MASRCLSPPTAASVQTTPLQLGTMTPPPALHPVCVSVCMVYGVVCVYDYGNAYVYVYLYVSMYCLLFLLWVGIEELHRPSSCIQASSHGVRVLALECVVHCCVYMHVYVPNVPQMHTQRYPSSTYILVLYIYIFTCIYMCVCVCSVVYI